MSAESDKGIIYMDNVWARYKTGQNVLQNINMNIKPTSNYAIVGLSGSGKTTLLKIINGMMRASRGTVLVDHQTPDQRSPKFRRIMSRIGYIPQSLGLVRNSSVFDNVMMGALSEMKTIPSLLKRYTPEDIARAKEILDKVGLKGKENRKAYMLSGGEKRRVAIARAFMQKPRILLADEIISELDVVTAHEVMDLVAGAQKETGLTAVMIHHDIKMALKFADRVAVIQNGHKVMELGVDNNTILDFQSGDTTNEEILSMYD